MHFMETLKYKVIHTSKEYQTYCTILEKLVGAQNITPNIQDEIELLTLLIEKWDASHNTFEEVDPIQLLKTLMKSQGLKSKDLVLLLGMSKGYISDILNYKKGLSKNAVRILANHFKLAQEAFNRPYLLIQNNLQTNPKKQTINAD